jgi:hypothetical protein
VLHSPHNDAVSIVLRHIDLLICHAVLDVQHTAHDLVVERLLVCQPLDIFSSVGIDVLEGAGELVIESLHNGCDASWDLENLSSHCLWWLVVILPGLGVLHDNHVAVLLEHLEKRSEFLIGPDNR